MFGLADFILVLDAETGSLCDLKKEGAARYWDHWTTRTYMVGMRGTGEATASLWELKDDPAPPLALLELAALPPEKCRFAAFNVQFDKQALERVGVHTTWEKWIDIMWLAYMLSFAGGVDEVAKQVFSDREDLRKSAEGKRLITKFSKPYTDKLTGKQYLRPWHTYPGDWEKFKDYCLVDTNVEHALLTQFAEWLDKPEFYPQIAKLYKRWLVTMRINERGLPVSPETITGALVLKQTALHRLNRELAELTGLDNPNSIQQLKGWLHAQGVHLDNLQAGTLREVRDSLPPVPQRVVDLRLLAGKASVKKYDAMARMVMPDRTIKGAYTPLGASRTGRDASRGINFANLERPSIDDTEFAADLIEARDADALDLFFNRHLMHVLGSCVRSVIKAPEGYGIAASDLKSIESVGLAWLAGCDTILDLFFEGKDSYKYFASLYYQKPYDQVTKKERNFSKPPFLGFGYGAWADALVEYAKNYGVAMNRDEAIRAITICRNEFKEIPAYWANLENAAMHAVRNPHQPVRVHAIKEYSYSGNHTYKDWPYVTYTFVPPFLQCKLPSGRTLFYHNPSVEFTNRGKYGLFYYGRFSDEGGKWQKIQTHGGKAAENVTQAVCYDALYDKIEWADEDPDIDVRGSTYDEIMVLLKRGDKAAYDRLTQIMLRRSDWMDERWFLGCEGYYDKARYNKYD